MNGTATVLPRILCTLDESGGGTNWVSPYIEWRGRNLFKNSSFFEGVGTPTNWTVLNYPVFYPHLSRTAGGRVARISRSGGTYNMLVWGASSTTSMEVDESTEYTVSAYTKKIGNNADFRIQRFYYRATGGGLGNSSAPAHTVSSTGWVRFETTFTTPAATAFCLFRFFCNTSGESIDVADIQLEKGSSATQYVNTSASEYQHVALERYTASAYDNISTGDNETDWAVNAKLRMASLQTSGVWADDGLEIDGNFFSLHTGLNHLYVNAPSSGNVTVTIDHQPEYF